jgi:hypothetical protein
MSAKDLRVSIQDLLDKTDDAEVLELVYSLLQKLMDKNEVRDFAFEGDGKPISEKEFIESVLESSRESKAKGTISHQDIKARFGIHE